MLVLCANIKEGYRFIKDIDTSTAIDMCRKSYYNPTPPLLILDYQWDIENPTLEYWYRKALYSVGNDIIVWAFRLPLRQNASPIEKETPTNSEETPHTPKVTIIPIDILYEDD